MSTKNLKMMIIAIALVALILIGCTQAAEPVPLPTSTPAPNPILSLDEGWTKIVPGGETRCAHDTEFAFWVRPGTVNKLMVYFQNGGGCWDWETCQKGSNWYHQTVTSLHSPEGRDGILDFDEEENPFADYHAVYVPSCTGDIFLGSNIETYKKEGEEPMDIFHHGYINLNSALEWTYANVQTPESIFVTGCSAGSIGSIRAAPHLINHYPDAQVTQLGDSLGFLFNTPGDPDSIYGSHKTFPEWIPEFADLDPKAFRMADFYNIVAAEYPNSQFAQFNTERDGVQVRYHVAEGQTVASFPEAMAGAISDIHTESPNFNSYTADGDMHCILPFQDFYSRTVDGVLFRDWVADLEAGADVANVQCADCLVSYPEE